MKSYICCSFASWEFGRHEVKNEVCCKSILNLCVLFRHFTAIYIKSHFSNLFFFICELGIWKPRGQTQGLL